MTMAQPAPRVLTIAGSDSSGGAGIQADLKTMLACGVHGMNVVTAITAQNSLGVWGVWPVPVDAVEAQFDAVVTDIGVDAVKTGMLLAPDVVELVATRVAGLGCAIVVDPVMASKHGDPLLVAAAVRAMRSELLPVATVVTPNLDEVEALVGVQVRQRSDLAEAARAVHALGPQWVLVKGGHLAGEAVDVLFDGARIVEFQAPRIANTHSHGTGCTLASAIASFLARGFEMEESVRRAKSYVTGAIAGGYPLGKGTGPVHHGWHLRQLDDGEG